VEFPLVVVFEPPSQAELRAWLRLRRVWVAGVLVVLAVGSLAAVAALGRPDALASGPGVPFSIVSHPSNARVWLDDRERGRTPLDLSITPGRHSLSMRAPGAQEGRYEVDVGAYGATLDASLFRSQPALSHVRAALPGASLSDVRLLTDRQLALSVMLGPDRLEAWRLDPATGLTTPMLTDIAARRVVVAGDGAHIAYVGREIGPPATGTTQPEASASVLWLLREPFSGTYAGWRPPLGEVVLDGSWSPQADGLLVLTGRPASSSDTPSATRVWWVDASAESAHELRSLPSLVVPGSETWSPDGQHVAFMAHAGVLNALCLVGIDGSFRYLADLEPSSSAPLPFAPVAWASNSQALLFVAPQQLHAPPSPSIWFQATPPQAVFEATLSDPTPSVVGDAQLVLPGWLADGRVVGLGRPGTTDDGNLSVQVLGPGSHLDRVLEVPLKPTRNYAAEWDAAHSRAVIADRTSSGATEYWVALLGADDAAEDAQ
jgi:PEGA domain